MRPMRRERDEGAADDMAGAVARSAAVMGSLQRGSHV
jgi:hypothetical protein